MSVRINGRAASARRAPAVVGALSWLGDGHGALRAMMLADAARGGSGMGRGRLVVDAPIR